jgi:hypothetical protein
MLLALNLHEHFIYEESVMIALMLPSLPLGIFRSEFIAPQANCLVAYFNATL